MTPIQKVAEPNFQVAKPSSTQSEPDNSPNLSVGVESSSDSVRKPEGKALKNRSIKPESLEKIPDLNAVREVKFYISALTEFLGSGNEPSGVIVKDREQVISLFNSMKACLESYETNNIPSRMPDLKKIEDLIEDGTGACKILCSKFESISNLRSCVNVDQEFIDKMYKYLNDDTCLEVYAGNGWLSSELKQKGCSITATDDFSRMHRAGKESSPFLREVNKTKASDAVADFIGKLKDKEQGTILICYPEGDLEEFKSVFEAPAQNPNIRIIAIGAEDMMMWVPPENLSANDITETVAYTPSKRERVMEYRFDAT